MLSPKNLENNDESTGAEHLADMMMSIIGGRGIHVLPLYELHDAPPDWNFFKPLPEGKFFELIQSIEQNGQLVPLIVWEREGGDGYTILSGHNRKRALERLFEQTKDPLYGKADSIIYKAGELTEGEARSIVVDCNWVQRTLSTTEKARAVYTKYYQINRMPRGTGRRRYDLVAEQFGLKATQVYQYIQIARLQENWLRKLDAGEISIKTAVHLSKLSPEQQNFLYEWPGITQREICAIDLTYAEDDMRRVLMRPEESMRELKVWVPLDRYAELRERINQWLLEPKDEA